MRTKKVIHHHHHHNGGPAWPNFWLWVMGIAVVVGVFQIFPVLGIIVASAFILWVLFRIFGDGVLTIIIWPFVTTLILLHRLISWDWNMSRSPGQKDGTALPKPSDHKAD